MAELRSLRCGNYEIYVANRGGTSLICRLTGSTSINFSRRLNEVSEAKVSVALNSKCRECLSTINPWQHELLLFRNAELVWSGPILTIDYKQASARIDVYARDLMAWTDKRLIELADTDYEVEGVDVKEVFDWVLRHGYDKDPWGMTWNLTNTGIPIDKYYPAYLSPDRWGGSYANVGAELRSLAQIGIDYTVVNRVMYGGDLVVTPPVAETLKISDRNWAQLPDVSVNGTVMSTKTVVAGGSGGYFGYYDEQLWIESTPNAPWGLLETFTQRSDLSDVDTTETPNAIAQEAYARHQLLSQPLAYIKGGQLAADAPFTFNTLIPGVPISVGIVETLRDLLTEYRLYNVTVNVTPDSETVDIELVSPGVSDLLT
jgi:hypothetical protein